MNNDERKIYLEYKKKVKNITKKYMKKYAYSFFGYDFMIGSQFLEEELTKDHKYSCYMGWKLNIPPHIISNLYNIQFLTKKQNEDKAFRCSIKLSELFRGYKNFVQRIDCEEEHMKNLEFISNFYKNKNKIEHHIPPFPGAVPRPITQGTPDIDKLGD